MKKILINATQENELRVAIVIDNKLSDLYIESESNDQRKANIYKGVITRVEQSLEATFVDYGESRQGFLPFKNISPQAISPDLDSNDNISEHIIEGLELIVQVEKEERGNKGAALTTNISLAGQYLILIPVADDSRTNGVSRSLSNDQRVEARKLLDKIDIPDNMRVIMRTSGIGKTYKELKWNLNYLIKIWELIYESNRHKTAPQLLYREEDTIIRTIRDYFRDDIDEMLIDNEEVFKKASDFISQVMPNELQKLQHFGNQESLFSHFKIENQIETVYSRNVSLSSGGEIVIDITEALIAIDVNSSKSTRGKDIEETALLTNLEAAKEITRQLRLRDLGGLIVIDFIDMLSVNNRKNVEQMVLNSAQFDRSKVKIGRISRFGLLELSRQHSGTSLNNLSRVKCKHCGGIHLLRTINSLCTSLLNLIEENANTKEVSEIRIQLPIDAATYLLNECRKPLNRTENRHGVSIIVIPNNHMEHPNYTIETIGISDHHTVSHNLKQELATTTPLWDKPIKNRSKALVDTIMPDTNAPKASFIKRLFGIKTNSEPKVESIEKNSSNTKRSPEKGQYRYRRRYYSGQGQNCSKQRSRRSDSDY